MTPLVGRAVERREDPALLAGRGRYVDDVALPVLPGHGTNVVAEQEVAPEPVTDRLLGAPHRLRLTLRNQRVAPLLMETIACVADR